VSESEIKRAEERIHDTGESKRRLREEIDATYKRLDESKVELLGIVDDTERTERSIAEHNALLEAAQQEAQRLRDEAAQLGHQIQECRSTFLNLEGEKTRQNNERTGLEGKCHVLHGQLGRARQRREKVHEELAELGLYRLELESTARNLSEKLEGLQARLNTINQEISQLEESLLSLDERLAAQRDMLTAKEARRQTLQDLERRREGMGAGVKQVLNAKQEQQLQGIVGTVSELLEVDVEYSLAIEAALTAAAQMLVTEQTVDTCLAIEFLRKDDRGRATFLPIDRVRANGNGQPPVTNNPNYLGQALNFIRVEERHKPVLAQLLAGTHLVRDFETAMNLAPKFPPSSRFVTLDGDVVCSSGPITGGGAVDRLGLISRKSELRQLEREVSDIRQLMARLSSEREETNRRLEELRGQRESTQTEITDTNMQLSETRLRLEQARREIDDLEQQDRLLESEVQDYRQQIARAEQRMQEIARFLAEIEAKEETVKSELAKLEAATTSIDARRETLRDTATKLQTSLATLGQKLEGFRTDDLRCRRTIQEQKGLLVLRFDEIDKCEERIRSSQEIIAKGTETLKGLFVERQRQEEDLRTERNRQEELRAQSEQNAAVTRQANGELRTIEETNNELRVQRSEAEMKRQNAIDHARSEMDLDLPEAYKQSQHDESRDWEAIHTDIQTLENRIHSLGSVNEEAIEDFEKLELRYQTLTSQERDLLEAKRKLQEIIRRINKTSRRLFETTFGAVREHFQDLFSKLFGGGKADIFLEEGVDILEAGIEIVAKPPGKSQNTVLSLLSGGERALCTVALLFAIFRARPSPFCILDEVDAPLDESNIDRFVTLVQEFNKRTQFIMITHNRRTMRAADTLYGITMQEAGVSTKVSVRFEDLEKDLG
jgi:chromosome segregation protein